MKTSISLSNSFITIFQLASKCGTSLYYNKRVSTRLSVVIVVSSRTFRDLSSSGGNNSDDSFVNVPYDCNFQNIWTF